MKSILRVVLLSFFLLVLAPSSAYASHSWGGYHWARTATPFSLRVADNLTSDWKSFLTTTNSDWSASAVLDMETVVGINNPKRCKPTGGRVEVCNSAYGRNGWLGIAQVWVSGGHITQGTTKVNDTYFNKPPYNTVAWKNVVMCQEVGHTLGLDHQDEDFGNTDLGTCMDYSNNPVPNQHPNAHDYEELASIYSHIDSLTTIGQTLSGGRWNFVDHENPNEWGMLVKKEGKTAVFERNLGFGEKFYTFVILAE